MRPVYLAFQQPIFMSLVAVKGVSHKIFKVLF
jgi:hypothetical protein